MPHGKFKTHLTLKDLAHIEMSILGIGQQSQQALKVFQCFVELSQFKIRKPGHVVSSIRVRVYCQSGIA